MSDEKQEMIPDGTGDKNNLNATTDEKDVDDNELDSSKVKFINANGGAEAHVTIDDGSETEFCGLTKEELMKYADDPYWVRVRWILLILFWVAWVGMLVAAIVIIVLAPRCPPRPDLEWWQTSTVCQVVPRSYQDTDGDGNGDIKGVEQHLDYLKDNNMTAVWLSPIFTSTNKDLGFDVVDHMTIDPQYGTMEDFNNLRSHMHRNGMKLILDFIPNHTSRNHTWFQQSIKGAADYSDYYIWHEGSAPPNNWLNMYDDPAWTLDSTRNAYYYHSLLADQPDLNLRNPKVQEELEAILRFWLDKGVDGFRVHRAAYLYESEGLEDQTEHEMTTFLPETYAQVGQWRKVLNEFSEGIGPYRFMMVDAMGTMNQTMGFYEFNDTKSADMPLNMNLLNLKADCNSHCVADLVHSWLSEMPEGRWANWQVGNDGTSRVGTRMGEKFVAVTNMLMQLLPGTAVSYYGDEIGMVDGVISFDQTRDILGLNAGAAGYEAVSRDPERTPMQWSNNKVNAGFTNASQPWLPVNEDYHTRNVEVQNAQGNSRSLLKVYREMARLRQEPSFAWGHYTHTLDASQKIYGFVRQAEGFEGFLVAANFDSAPGTADFFAAHPDVVPRRGVVVATTIEGSRQNEFRVGQEVQMDDIYLASGEGVVFKWAWEDTPEE